MFNSKWDRNFMSLAKMVGSWSKDPSCAVGAVIVRPDKTIASLGYNGFPRQITDHPHLYLNRTSKYERIIHAEMNAILNAKERLDGYILYVSPLLPCPRCTVHIIQAGIVEIVSNEIPPEMLGRWGPDIQTSKNLFHEAGVEVRVI